MGTGYFIELSGKDRTSLAHCLGWSDGRTKAPALFAECHVRVVSRMIRDRTRAAMSHKRQNGERVSRFAPFGFRFEGSHTLPDPAEQAVIVQLRSMREAGMSLQAICDALMKHGIPTKRSKGEWKPMTVSRILKRA